MIRRTAVNGAGAKQARISNNRCEFVTKRTVVIALHKDAAAADVGAKDPGSSAITIRQFKADPRPNGRVLNH